MPIGCIVLIDDEQITNFVNKMIIEKMDICTHVKAYNLAEEALEEINSNYKNNGPLPDYTFVDINMPEMSGWEFIEAFSQLDEGLKSKVYVFMLSSSQNEDDITRAYQSEYVKGFIGKPLTPEKLMNIIGE